MYRFIFKHTGNMTSRMEKWIFNKVEWPKQAGRWKAL